MAGIGKMGDLTGGDASNSGSTNSLGGKSGVSYQNGIAMPYMLAIAVFGLWLFFKK